MRTKKGTITSAKMTGTVKVSVDATIFHPVYKKRFKRSKTYLVDSNGHDLYEGDKVEISECRPLSKNKYFKVTEIISQATRVSDMKEEKSLEETINPEKEAPTPVKKEVEKKEEVKKEEKKESSDKEDSPTES